MSTLLSVLRGPRSIAALVLSGLRNGWADAVLAILAAMIGGALGGDVVLRLRRRWNN